MRAEFRARISFVRHELSAAPSFRESTLISSGRTAVIEQYVIGQRWVSSSESELGLGIVAEIANRRVTVTFPAANERRTYAVDDAPLSRVLYNVGESIRADDGRQLLVTERQVVDGCIVYFGVGADGERQSIDEIDLDSFVQFSHPLKRMFAGHLDKPSAFTLRADAIRFQHQHQCSDAFGLLGPRAQLLEHQFYIAAEIGRRTQPRVLLADEVGLGKTIEAGLIVHQQLMSGRAERVLIVVPDSLVHQWLVEMMRRFNLQFSIVRSESLDTDEEDEDDFAVDDNEEFDATDDANRFEDSQLVLCPLSEFVESDESLQAAIAAGWDLLVVDEAHHLAWSAAAPSPAYRCIEQLAREVDGVLLITATPEQLGIEGHFARLRLLDPDRFPDLERYLVEEQRYREIGELAGHLRQAADSSTLEQSVMQALRPLLSPARLRRARRRAR